MRMSDLHSCDAPEVGQQFLAASLVLVALHQYQQQQKQIMERSRHHHRSMMNMIISMLMQTDSYVAIS